MSCSSYARAKAACKPFNTDGAQRKAKEEMVRRAQARKMKKWTDTKWKKQVLEKLEKVDKLIIQVWRVVDVLERIAEVRLKTPEDNIISWLESRGEKTEILKRIDKGKQREQSSDRAEEDEEIKG